MERFRRHLAEYVSQKQTGALYGDCSDSGVTYSPRAEEERAGCSDAMGALMHDRIQFYIKKRKNKKTLKMRNGVDKKKSRCYLIICKVLALKNKEC